MRIGIDAGGTFTDFVVLRDDGRIETFKLRSNPANPAAVILAGIERAAAGRKIEIVHGSTVATNALLERKGARTALVTTVGFEDLLTIGRQNRAELYNLTPPPKRLLVDREMCFGVTERAYVDAPAEVPDLDEVRRLIEALKNAGTEAVALCFLHSYRWNGNEETVAAELEKAFPVSVSSRICPEFREYERGSTTAINAYVAPLMDRYLGALERECRHPLFIMQSNGGLLRPAEARRHAVRTILSGPAGGVVGAFEIAKRAGFRRILGFDMGGTSTDVCLCDGRFEETTEATVDGMPVRVPMLDVHTVGAGGGSIARIDDGGLLRVGPQSAGADPGPACYGTGSLPTVTDAHAILGRIAASQLLGGEMEIAVDRAIQAVATLGGDPVTMAAGIVRVANANMQRAIRAVSVERGHDPRDFALVAFGGGGGLHACEIAEDLDIRTVLAPRDAGVLSALGMLLADRIRDYSIGSLGLKDVDTAFRKLERQARRDLPGATLERFADLRYCGQSYELTVPWTRAVPNFERRHQSVYGYRMDAETEVVTLRVRSRIRTKAPRLTARTLSSPSTSGSRRIWTGGKWRQVPVQGRSAGRGPALILDYGSTVLVPPGWRFSADRLGTLAITRR